MDKLKVRRINVNGVLGTGVYAKDVILYIIRRLGVSRPRTDNDVCYGTLLSREQYLYDLERLRYRDSRAEPTGSMTDEQIAAWTAAIGKED